MRLNHSRRDVPPVFGICTKKIFAGTLKDWNLSEIMPEHRFLSGPFDVSRGEGQGNCSPGQALVWFRDDTPYNARRSGRFGSHEPGASSSPGASSMVTKPGASPPVVCGRSVATPRCAIPGSFHPRCSLGRSMVSDTAGQQPRGPELVQVYHVLGLLAGRDTSHVRSSNVISGCFPGGGLSSSSAIAEPTRARQVTLDGLVRHSDRSPDHIVRRIVLAAQQDLSVLRLACSGPTIQHLRASKESFHGFDVLGCAGSTSSSRDLLDRWLNNPLSVEKCRL